MTFIFKYIWLQVNLFIQKIYKTLAFNVLYFLFFFFRKQILTVPQWSVQKIHFMFFIYDINLVCFQSFLIIGRTLEYLNWKQNSEFKTIEKAVRNKSTIFPENWWLFTINKEKETLANHDHLHSEGTEYYKNKC